MEQIDTLIVGAGISGLAAAAALGDDYLILEGDTEIGGYCKTVKRDGFVWDYSGHFFHFKHPDIEQHLRERMRNQRVLRVNKRSFIQYQGELIDFPFQKNIHQLSKTELIECLHDLYFAGRDAAPPTNFKDMLYARFGRGISEKFLIPYNEKLYACDLSQLDIDAMGRFFPHASVAEIIRNMREPDNSSYNQTFTYPEGGAIEYVHALARDVDAQRIALGESLQALDLQAHVARTSRRELRYKRLISSEPFMRFAARTGLDYDAQAFSWNKVLVFNLGFDKKGPEGVHWVYFPDPTLSFYRVGFYDNIFDSERMSLYVEIGLAADARVDRDALQKRVLEDLRKASIITDHQLVADHAVVMDPAYVHITQRSIGEVARVKARLAQHDVYSIGRYGSWTYCSIEDNIVEARALAKELHK
ncbi:MAG TPA: NAD(P)-binding protein [Polyangiales bacterium]|jgi:protoporphyrinogen oxidase|nr:NAD(P)-binding protein [Polyangiales bacterium]